MNIKATVLTIVLWTTVSHSLAAPNSGVLVAFNQPNATVFMAREYGDEFLSRSENEDGYTFLLDYTTGWFVYATHDLKGNLIKTNLRVGVDDPTSIGLEKHVNIHPQSGWH